MIHASREAFHDVHAQHVTFATPAGSSSQQDVVPRLPELPVATCKARQRTRHDEMASWITDAKRHVPARSGRHAAHAVNRARGDGGGNKGIGRGMARGTEEAQADFRMHTLCCAVPDCDALVDAHWARRGDQTKSGWCSGCRAAHGASRKRHLKAQLRMAEQLDKRERRLVVFADGQAWVLPAQAVDCAAAAARRRVAELRAHPPRQGRPRKHRSHVM